MTNADEPTTIVADGDVCFILADESTVRVSGIVEMPGPFEKIRKEKKGKENFQPECLSYFEREAEALIQKAR